MPGSPATGKQPEGPLLPCLVKDCPWEAELREGNLWLCDKHNEATFVWDEKARTEAEVFWPKIPSLDARIRGATERLIRYIHGFDDTFEMFTALTSVALGMEKRVADLPEPKPKKRRGGIPV